VITLGKVETSGFNFVTVVEQIKMQALVKVIVRVLNIETKDLEHLKLPDYIPVPMHFFYLMSRSVCDVFIKLTKSGEDQYVKRLKSNEEFDKSVIQKYEGLKVTFLYIPKDYRYSFMDSLLDQTLNKLDDSGLKDDKLIEIHTDTFDISQTLIQTIGIKPQTILLADKTIQSMTQTAMRGKKVGSLIKTILSTKGSYGYRHSYLVALLSFGIIPKLDWGGTGKRLTENFEKIVFVAFFHDILLKKEKLVRINDKIELYKSALTDDEKTLVMNHANIISGMIQKFPHAPQGVDVILKQHHGMTNGMGFAETFRSTLSGMSILFIVLEEFVTSVFNFEKGTLSLLTILEKMREKFSLPSYRKIVDLLEQSIKDGF